MNFIKNLFIFYSLIISSFVFSATRDLNIQFEGTQFVESNSPEVVFGPGYVFKNDGNDQQRGGQDYPLIGCSQIYFFHINKSKRNLYFHLLIKSKNGKKTKASLKGSAYTNNERPLGEKRGQSYQTALDWLTKSYRYQKEVELSQQYRSILSKRLNRNGMLDGKIEVCSKDSYYINLVFSDSAYSKRTVELFSKTSADGIILPVNRSTYGRVAAIFEKSEINAKIDINSDIHKDGLKWHVNTISKFEADRELQDQTMQCVSNLSDSSCVSNGNYGREYNIELKINNVSSGCRKYKLLFASNFKSNVNKPSFTWNCPTLVSNKIVPTFTTPTQPELLLKTFIVKQGEVKKINLKFIPCGLITAKQNLRLNEFKCE